MRRFVAVRVGAVSLVGQHLLDVEVQARALEQRFEVRRVAGARPPCSE